jgi:hypothetical protein
MKKKEDSSIDDKMQTGFSNFLDCLNLYLDLFEDLIIYEESRVKIYGSVTLENGAIIRAINSYHSKAWFSNISILMNPDESSDYQSDQGVCYGQVIIYLFVKQIIKDLLIKCLFILFVDFVIDRDTIRKRNYSIKTRINSMV